MFRTDPPPARQVPTLLAVLSLLVVGVAACTGGRAPAPAGAAPPVPPVTRAEVLAAVHAAPQIRALPADLTPPLATVARDIGFDHNRCEAAPAADRVEACVLGDPASSTRVVLYGDSHAGMWLPALTEIGQRRHWQVRFFGKPACPTPEITFWYQQGGRPFTECDRFRAYVVGQVRSQRPDLVLVTSASFGQKTGPDVRVTPRQWQAGLTRTLSALHRWAGQVVVLGDIPVLDESAPDCLAAHTSDVRACATTEAAATARVWNAADRAAARATRSRYITVLPWLCTAVCPPVIGNIVVYRDRFRLTATYVKRLNGVLEGALTSNFSNDVAP